MGARMNQPTKKKGWLVPARLCILSLSTSRPTYRCSCPCPVSTIIRGTCMSTCPGSHLRFHFYIFSMSQLHNICRGLALYGSDRSMGVLCLRVTRIGLVTFFSLFLFLGTVTRTRSCTPPVVLACIHCCFSIIWLEMNSWL